MDEVGQIRDALALLRASVADVSGYGAALRAMDEDEARRMVNALVIMSRVDRDSAEFLAWCDSMAAQFRVL